MNTPSATSCPQAGQKPKFSCSYVVTVTGDNVWEAIGCASTEHELKQIEEAAGQAFIDAVSRFWQTPLENAKITVQQFNKGANVSQDLDKAPEWSAENRKRFAASWGTQSELVTVKRLAKPFGPNLFVAKHSSHPRRRTYGKTEREAATKCFFYFSNPEIECTNPGLGFWVAKPKEDACQQS